MKLATFTVLATLLIGCNSSADKMKKEDLPVDSNTITQPATLEVFSIQPVKLTKEQLPADVKFKGALQEAWQWKDKLGENILITSSFGPFKDKAKDPVFEEEGETQELHVFHFIRNDIGWKTRWVMSDAEKVCPFDLTATFLKNSTLITDLDKNGIAETTIQYKFACRSDVSPAYMKLIMHEDTAKYSLRGATWVFDGGNGKFEVTEKDVNLEKLAKPRDEIAKMYQLYGRYETEKEFAKASPEFLIHARSQWLKHAYEKFD